MNKHRNKWLSVVLGLFFFPNSLLFGDLFVEAIATGNVGELLSFDYLSSDSLPPEGKFGKIVVLQGDTIIGERLSPSGSFDVVFNDPGLIEYTVLAYDVDGDILDSINRSIWIYGIGMIQPQSQCLYAQGSRLFLAAEAVFLDKLVESVEFEYRRLGDDVYRKIFGSEDETYPYSYLYEPPSVGVWEIRAVAYHNNEYCSFSSPVTIQVCGTNQPNLVSCSILDPSLGKTVQCGIKRKVSIDVSISNTSVVGVSLFVNGILQQSEEVSEDTQFPYQFDWIPAHPGDYSLVAFVETTSGFFCNSEEIIVNVTDDRPQLTILSPVEGSHFEEGKKIPIHVIAAGQGGSRDRVQFVEFLVNGNAVPIIGLEGLSDSYQDKEPPFETFWTPEYPGNYFISGRVVDEITGISYQSHAVSVYIDAACPTVVLLDAPYSGDVFHIGETITLKASAKVSNALIDEVSFYVNDVWVGNGEFVDHHYQMDYQFESTGRYRIKVMVRDDRSRSVYSETITVLVESRQFVRPTVQIEWPTSSDIYEVGDTFQAGVNVFDEDGHIKSVRYWLNEEPLGGTVSQHPFTSDEVVLHSPGRYKLEAQAEDNDGNLSVRSAVEFEVKNQPNLRPDIHFSKNYEERSYELGDSFIVEVEALDSDGFIKEVQFFINGKIWGNTDQTYPYQSEVFELSIPGKYKIQALAIDDMGNLSKPISQSVYVVAKSDSDPVLFDPLSDNRDFIQQLYTDLLDRDPTDSEMNRCIESLDFDSLSRPDVVVDLFQTNELKQYRHINNAFHMLLGKWPSVTEYGKVLQGLDRFADDPDLASRLEVGDDFNTAYLIDDLSTSVSGYLDEIGDVDMYVFQIPVSGFVQIQTHGASDTTATLYNLDGEQIAYDDDRGKFFNFKIDTFLDAGTYYLAVSGWAGGKGSYDLVFGDQNNAQETDVEGRKDLEQVIESIYNSNTFFRKYGNPNDFLNTEFNRRLLFGKLFRNRYGYEPTLQQSIQGANRIKDSDSLVSFTSKFLISSSLDKSDYIYNLPNTIRRDDAAFLFRAFFKEEPKDSSLESILNFDLYNQVDYLLSHSSYRSRFEPFAQTGENPVLKLKQVDGSGNDVNLSSSAIDRFNELLTNPDELKQANRSPFDQLNSTNGWKYLDWFGWFSDIHYPWVFHEHLGWINLNAISLDEFQIWHQQFNWSYTGSQVYPYLYRYDKNEWFRLDLSDEN